MFKVQSLNLAAAQLQRKLAKCASTVKQSARNTARKLSIPLLPLALVFAAPAALAATGNSILVTNNAASAGTYDGVAGVGACVLDVTPPADHNLQICTNDEARYKVAYALNPDTGPNTFANQANATITLVIPAAAPFRFSPGSPILAACSNAGTAISMDKRTLTCILKGLAPNPVGGPIANQAADLFVDVVTNKDAKNGDTLASLTGTISSTQDTTALPSVGPGLTVIAQPRADLWKSYTGITSGVAKPAACGGGGAPGIVLDFAVGLDLDRIKGHEALQPGWTYVENFTEMTSDACIFDVRNWNTVGGTAIWPPLGAQNPGGLDTGGGTYTWAGTPGGTYTITSTVATPANTSGDVVGSAYGRTKVTALHQVRVWLSVAAASGMALIAGDDGNACTFQGRNTLQSFDPNGISTVSNYGAGTEPTMGTAPDNVAVVGPIPLCNGSYEKLFTSNDKGVSKNLIGQAPRMTNQLVGPNDYVDTYQYFVNSGVSPARASLCDKFDSRKLRLDLLDPAVNKSDYGGTLGATSNYQYQNVPASLPMVSNTTPAYVHIWISSSQLTRGPTNTNGEIEFGYVDVGAGYDEALARAATCNDADSILIARATAGGVAAPPTAWVTQVYLKANPTLVPFVNAIRLKDVNVPVGSLVQLFSHFSILTANPSGGATWPDGTILPNHSALQTDSINFGSCPATGTAWCKSTNGFQGNDPLAINSAAGFCTPANQITNPASYCRTGYDDRLRLSTESVSVRKGIAPSDPNGGPLSDTPLVQTSKGSIETFQLWPNVTAKSAGVMINNDIILIDTLPAGLKYVPDSAKYNGLPMAASDVYVNDLSPAVSTLKFRIPNIVAQASGAPALPAVEFKAEVMLDDVLNAGARTFSNKVEIQACQPGAIINATTGVVTCNVQTATQNQSEREATRTIQLAVSGALIVQKSVIGADTKEVGQPFTMGLRYLNAGTSSVDEHRLIDILPANGETDRGNPSLSADKTNFSGTRGLTGMTTPTGAYEVYYTTKLRTDIDTSAKCASNTGVGAGPGAWPTTPATVGVPPTAGCVSTPTTWLLATGAAPNWSGFPASTTAVMVVDRVPFPSGAVSRLATMTFPTPGSKDGNKYSNNVIGTNGGGAAGGGATFAVFSNNVTVQVVAASIKGTVFIDPNANGGTSGFLPAEDTGLGGVTMTLKQGATTIGTALTATAAIGAGLLYDRATGLVTATASATTCIVPTGGLPIGGYLFCELLAGTGYSVTEMQPAGLSTTGDKAGTGSPAGTVSNATDVISGIGLTVGQKATGYDFGEISSTTVGGTIYADLNQNGTYQAGVDSLLSDVTVTMTCTNGYSQTQTTGSVGTYLFTGVAPLASCTITETQPAIYGDATTNPGTGSSSASPNVISVAVPLMGSVNNNFGERVGSLSGKVFNEVTTAGIGGETINLTGTAADGTTSVSRSTTTATAPVPAGTLCPNQPALAVGEYFFCSLPVANAAGYLVSQPAQPTGTFNSNTTAGGTGGTASNPTATSSRIANAGMTLAQVNASPAVGATSPNNNFGETIGYNVSGTIWNDANNTANNAFPANIQANTPGTDPGTNAGGLNAVLVDSTGKVIGVQPVLANGTYLFPAVPPANGYQVVLSTSSPMIGAIVAPSLIASVPAAWVGTSPLVYTPFNVVNADVPNRDFGIERPPVAVVTSKPSQVNPGGTTRVQAPTLSGTDAEDGALGNGATYTIETLPTNAVLYYNGAPVTAGQVITNYDPTLLTIDPNDATQLVVFTYSVTDKAGKKSPPATATAPFTGIKLSGTVYIDANASAGATPNGSGTFPTINQPAELGTNTGGLNAVLVDVATGNVIAVVPVNSNGQYLFPDVPTVANLKVLVTSANPPVGSPPASSSLPLGWENTSPLAYPTFATALVDVINKDFGVQRPPLAYSYADLTKINPGGTTRAQVPPQALQGFDAEDGIFGAGNTFTIESLPTNATLYYNGVPVAAGQVIPNFDPTKLTIDPIDGSVVTTFTYSVTDTAGRKSNIATVTLPFETIAVSGKLWDDANNSANNTFTNINDGIEQGTNANGVNAVLVDTATGKVIATAPLNPDGTYLFVTVPPNTNVTVILTTSSPVAGATAPVPNVPAAWINTTPLTQTSFNTGITGAINKDFGVEQLPNTDDKNAPTQVNPGSTVQVQVPSLSGNDPEDGGKGTGNPFKIITLPTNAVLYYNGVPVVAGQLIPMYNSALLKVDPIDGAQVVTFKYVSIDAAGKEDPTPAVVTMPFSTIVVSGKIWDDANGSANNTFANINSPSENGTNAGALNAVLVDAATNAVIAIVPVNPDGTYLFPNVAANTNVTVLVTTDAPTVGSTPNAPVLPSTWFSTSPLTQVPFNTGTTGAVNKDFGIEQLPNSDNKTSASQPNPGAAVQVPVPALSGTDPEDGTKGTGSTFIITALPTNATLFYNGAPVTAGQVITNYDPTKLTVDPIDGNVVVTFQYVAVDAAGKQDPTPAMVTMPFGTLAVSGKVWDDANNSAAGTFANINNAGESGTNAGGLQAVLVNATTNTVIAVVPVNADGTYLFPNVPANTNVSVVITTTAPAAGAPTPAPAIPANWVNTSPLTQVPFNTGTTGAVNKDFGIEQLPNSDNKTSASQPNPGAAVQVPVPALSGTDPEDGTKGTGSTFIITTLPTNATLFYNGAPVTAGQVITNYDPTKLTVDPIDGNVVVTFQYVAVDAAGKQDPTPAMVTMPFGTLAVSGKVWDDANNSAAGTFANINNAGESGTNAGGLQAVLVNATTNTVIAVVPVNADGTYLFPNVPANTNVSVVITTTAPAAGAPTPAPAIPANWVNTSPLTQVPFNTGTTGAVNKDFGIEQLPNSDNKTSASQPNPGAAVQVPVPALSGTDPEDGTKGTGSTFIITTLPTNATLFYNGAPVTAGQVITNYDPTKLTVDPIDGNVVVTFQYVAVDAAGKQDPTPATVTMPFGTLAVSGKVWDDANNSAAGTFANINNAGESGTNAGGLQAVLVNATTNTVIAVVPVNADGTYLFPNVPANTNVSVVITTTAPAAGAPTPAPAIPANWVNTSPLTQAPFNTGTTGAVNKDFGIEQLPNSDDKTVTAQPNPTGTTQVPVPALSGTDPEDGVKGTGSSLRITTLPTNATLFYNGAPVTAGQVITNYDPTKLTVDPIDGVVTVSFTYAIIDNAGKQDPTPATVTIPFNNTPVTYSVGNRVWQDTNSNGTREASEPGIVGATVRLLDGNGVGVIATSTTDSNGYYRFDNLPAGNYQVEVVLPTGMTNGGASATGVNPNNDIDNDNNGIVVVNGAVRANAITLGPVAAEPIGEADVAGSGQGGTDANSNMTVDFGLTPAPSSQPIQLVKTLYEGLSNGAGCPTAKTKLVVVDKTGTGIDVTYCFKVTNPGPAHMTNVKITDTKLDLGTNAQVLSIGTLTQVPGSGVLPLAPGASVTFFRTTKIIGSLTNVATVEGTPSNAAGVPTGAAPSTASSGSAILASIIDPPSVLKVGTLAGANLVEWRMVWINSSAEFATNVTIVDPIPVDNGFAGTLTCTAKGTSVTRSCDFIAPTAANPRGSVVWNGSIGVDNGRPTEATALNAVVISFRATVTPGVASVSNQATSSWDYDGDGVPELTNVLSDDPAVSGATNPTRLQLISTNQQVPTLSEWALLLLILMMAGFGYRELKRSGRFDNI